MSNNVIGLHACKICQAPLHAHDRRRRHCDDCKPPALAMHEPVVDTSKAGRPSACRCARPLLYEEDGDVRCGHCGRAAAEAARVAA